jgi:hypothetical protein
VYEALRLLQLAPPVRKAVKAGSLPASHAGLVAKLPVEFQATYAKAIAPGKTLLPKEERALDSLIGYVDFRDEESGLVPFRDAKEIIDSALDDIEKGKAYEKIASEFRKKGGVALTLIESRSDNQRDYVTAGDYLGEFSSYVRDVVKGIKDLPKMIMRPLNHDASKAEMVYEKNGLLAALKKAGVKPRSGTSGTSMVDYNRRERERQARQRIAKAGLKAAIDPIRAAAGKRNAKIPWPLFIVAMAGWTASQICARRGWKANYQNASEMLADHLAKMPENQMPGLVADILIEKVTTAHTGGYQPEFVKLGNFYGVDVKAIQKAAQQKLAPPEKKKPVKAQVQTPGKAKQKVVKPPSSRKSGTTAGQGKATGLSAAGRKKLAAAMKARWAARRKEKK